jgi:two-component system cell cycle sensor histidine kinase PleC
MAWSKIANTQLLTSRLWMRAIFAFSAITLLVAGYRFDVVVHENFYQKARAEATLDMLKLRREIEGVLIEQSLMLRELAAFVGGHPNISQAEFSSLARNMRGIDPSTITIAAAPDLVVAMVYPFEGNEGFLGFDYRESVELLPGVLSTLGSGEDLMVGPVELPRGGLGIILRAPVYFPANSVNNRSLWGVVSIALSYHKFIDKVGLTEAALSYDLLIDFSVPSSEYDGQFFGEKGVLDTNPITLSFDFPYGALSLHATPKVGWSLATPTQFYARTIIALISVGLLGLLAYIMWLAETRKRAQEQLCNGIEALDDGFVIFDANDDLIVANAKYAEIHNYPKEVMQSGTPYSEILRNATLKQGYLLSPEKLAEWIRHRTQARQSGESFDYIHNFGNGAVIKASDRRMPDGSYVGLRVDVTELTRARKTAEASSKAKTDFMNVLSHELRTPMTVVMGVAGLTKNARLLSSSKILLSAIESGDRSNDEIATLLDDMFAQHSELMGRMIKSGDHMMELINGMLDFAKIESGSILINPTNCNIKDIMEPVEQLLSTLAQEKGLVFEVQQECGAVWADSVRVRQILFNLVGNAIKFTESGSVRVTVKMDADTVIFAVHDEGPGIPAAELKSIFDPFYQVDSSATRHVGGTGMGLAISRNFAELNGGKLTVTSTLGEGSRFTLTLPSADAAKFKEAGIEHS